MEVSIVADVKLGRKDQWRIDAVHKREGTAGKKPHTAEGSAPVS